MIAFLLLAVGLFLIMVEFYLPGAIMGILGGLFVLTSIITFASQANSALAIVIFILFAALSIGLLVKFTLKKIVSSKSDFSIYSNKDQEGYQASEYDKSALGKSGTVLSDLKPGGYILVDGKQHQAISITGYIPKGEEVTVLTGQEESLIVKKKESKS